AAVLALRPPKALLGDRWRAGGAHQLALGRDLHGEEARPAGHEVLPTAVEDARASLCAEHAEARRDVSWPGLGSVFRVEASRSRDTEPAPHGLDRGAERQQPFALVLVEPQFLPVACCEVAEHLLELIQ